MHLKGAGHVYVAGRVRQPGEMNGKSGNLNNVLTQLYGDLPIPGNEILCILDADMVSLSQFKCKASLQSFRIASSPNFERFLCLLKTFKLAIGMSLLYIAGCKGKAMR